MGTFSQIAQNRKWVANAEFGQRSRRLSRLYDALAADVFPILADANFIQLDIVPAGFAAWTGNNRIVFQNRDATEWPTIEFELGKRAVGYCKVHIGVLPPECWSLAGERVPQDEAAVWMSPVYLTMSRNARRGKGRQEFGVRRFLLFEKAEVEKDVATLKALMQVALDQFRQGASASWRGAKHYAVHPNLVLMWGPWNPIRVNRSIPSGHYYRELI